ncbi:MAG: hypothetical protein J1F25_00765 [Prevotellaceae bacterium]|nr:hypothetical protein [Prevotellaceae bacterium]
MKNIACIFMLVALVACSTSHRRYASIDELKQELNATGCPILFETDSTLVYVHADTICAYQLKYDRIERFTNDDVVCYDMELDLTKLYPMATELVCIDANILADDNLCDILRAKDFVVSNREGVIFSRTHADDMMGEVEVLYQFSVVFADTLATQPRLLRLGYGELYEVQDDAVQIRHVTYQSYYPPAFTDMLSDVITDPAIRSRFEEGGALVSNMTIAASGIVTSVIPSNICFGRNWDINIPIYGYGENKDLIQAIEASM